MLINLYVTPSNASGLDRDFSVKMDDEEDRGSAHL